MTEQTKQRLRERFEQILSGQDKRARTIDDIEQIALSIGRALTQASVEEVSKEAQTLSPAQTMPSDTAGQTSEDAPEEDAPEIATKLACLHCHKNAWCKGLRKRSIQTLAGWLTLERAYYYCRRCKQGFCPLDGSLGIVAGQSCTHTLAQEIALLSASLPYDMAMAMLGRLTPVCVSGRSAQRLCTGPVAEVVDAFVAERDATMLPLAYGAEEQIPVSLPQPVLLYLQADGIQTPMADGSWREMKVGVVRAELPDGREQMPARYISHLGEAATFGRHWEALALSCGSLKAQCLSVLGDGAAWIWNLATTRFPKAVQILDFYHASEYVAAVARDAFSEQEALVKSWLSARLSELKRSQWSAFWAALDALGRPGLESLVSLRTYFANHASRMHYAAYLKAGLCIGSGLAESSCKRIVTQRLKGAGMHWSEQGAQVIARLRGFYLGGQWQDFTDFWNAYATRPATSPL
jgi:hypothetical protein